VSSPFIRRSPQAKSPGVARPGRPGRPARLRPPASRRRPG